MNNPAKSEAVMKFTGERMVPEGADINTYWEHVFRYSFACKRVKGLTVLDIASGEGYGTYALSKVAKDVIGVDISAEAVSHATEKYGLDFRVGSAEAVPVASESVEAVVSFETIEHVPSPERFVREVFRVLKPGGIIIISTPNKNRYLKGQESNPFHCSELTRAEFVTLLNQSFEVKEMWGQVEERIPLDRFQMIISRISCRLACYVRRKVEEVLKRKYLPQSVASDVKLRRQFVESIPGLELPFDQMWNPYALRSQPVSLENESVYIIAVAHRRACQPVQKGNQSQS